MRIFLLFVLPLIYSTLAICQDSTTVRKSDFDSTIKMIPTFSGRYRGVAYVSSDNTPLFKRDISERLMSYEPSAKEYVRHKSARVGSGVWGCFAIISCVISAANYNNSGPRMTFAGITVVTLILEGINAVMSRNHFDRAIKLYNDHYRR